ncbi:MAG: hypothetical protein M1826_000677 [Phylliscum demangeonii]|nr:MAG: hypothetical protein M1826_000677 [Phylliscum demangeonii]
MSSSEMATATAHADATLAALRKMFQSGAYSDLVIRCHGQEFRVHRSVVCPRSTFFETACASGFQEAFSGVIELDDDLGSVSRMLSYIYTTDYEDASDAAEHDRDADSPVDAIEPVVEMKPSSMNAATSISMSDDAPETTEGPPAADDVNSATPSEKASGHLAAQAVKNNVLVYAMADKYDVPLLKVLAREKFTARAEAGWPPAGLTSILRLVYETTPDHDRGLRMVVGDLCARHLRHLLPAQDFGHSLRGLRSFSVDVLLAFWARYDAEQGSLEVQVADLGDKLDTANRRVTKLENYLKDAKKIVEKNSNCRHCRIAFKPSLDNFNDLAMNVKLGA